MKLKLNSSQIDESFFGSTFTSSEQEHCSLDGYGHVGRYTIIEGRRE